MMKWFGGAGSRKKSTKGRIDALGQRVQELAKQVEEAKFLAARGLIRDFYAHAEPLPLARTEFKVFSQFGDDGIIQYVLQRLNLPAAEQRFIEFGVESYAEANTRFLLLNDNWSGLIMDGSEEFMAAVRRSAIYWRHELTALGRFITREGINALLEEAGFTGRIGLLSIDIDGNDYWVWEAITVADPALVIVEYNGLFGAREAVTIPYQADFTRHAAHASHLYWGASLAALCHLAAAKGYAWIGCNLAGNNAYFVRQAEATRFLCPTLPEGFVAAKYREARNEEGGLAFIGQKDGISLVGHLPVWDVVQNRTRLISELMR
jgi:hypothetical protein